MINGRLLTPRNVVAIAAITVVTHFVARPLFTRVSRKEA